LGVAVGFAEVYVRNVDKLHNRHRYVFVRQQKSY
jgi:hypothetical protein